MPVLEGGSVRPDGSVRPVRRIREAWQDSARAFIPPRARGKGESSRRTLQALAASSDLEEAKMAASMAPAVLHGVTLDELPPGCVSMRRLNNSQTVELLLLAAGAGSLIEWFVERLRHDETIELSFPGRSREQRRELYAVLDAFVNDIDAISKGFGRDRTLRIRSKSCCAKQNDSESKQPLESTRLWELVSTERIAGRYADQARELSKGEFEELFALNELPEWLAELQQDADEQADRLASLRKAVRKGHIDTIRVTAARHRSLLFVHTSPPLLHVAIRAGQLEAAALLLQLGVPRLTFDRASGESALDLALRLGRSDFASLLRQESPFTTNEASPP